MKIETNLVVQTLLLGLEDKVPGVILEDLLVLVEFLGHLRLLESLLGQINIDSVAHIGVEIIKVGVKFIDLDIVNLEAIIVQLLVGVDGQFGGELVVVIDDAVVQLIENWISQAGIELFQGSWQIVVVQTLTEIVSAQVHLGEEFEVFVELDVLAISISVDEVSKIVDSLWLGHINLSSVILFKTCLISSSRL